MACYNKILGICQNKKIAVMILLCFAAVGVARVAAQTTFPGDATMFGIDDTSGTEDMSGRAILPSVTALPDVMVMPILEEGVNMAGRSQVTLDLGVASIREVRTSANYNPVQFDLPEGTEPPIPDYPPDASLTGGIRYSLSSQVFPAEDGDHMQMWLWDTALESLVYTDEMVCEYGFDEDARVLLGTMITWIFSHIKDGAVLLGDQSAEAEAPAPVEEPPVFEVSQPVAVEAPPQFQERPSLVEGIYVDGALQYYIMPEGKGFGYSWKVSSVLPGFRLAAGILLNVGIGDLGVGLGTGYNQTKLIGEDGPININFIPILFKVDYILPVWPAYGLEARVNAGAGFVVDMRKVTRSRYLDWVFQAGVYLHWNFVAERWSLYAGGGLDILPEQEGSILMPSVELGLRWKPFLNRH